MLDNGKTTMTEALHTDALVAQLANHPGLSPEQRQIVAETMIEPVHEPISADELASIRRALWPQARPTSKIVRGDQEHLEEVARQVRAMLVDGVSEADVNRWLRLVRRHVSQRMALLEKMALVLAEMRALPEDLPADVATRVRHQLERSTPRRHVAESFVDVTGRERIGEACVAEIYRQVRLDRMRQQRGLPPLQRRSKREALAHAFGALAKRLAALDRPTKTSIADDILDRGGDITALLEAGIGARTAAGHLHRWAVERGVARQRRGRRKLKPRAGLALAVRLVKELGIAPAVAARFAQLSVPDTARLLAEHGGETQ